MSALKLICEFAALFVIGIEDQFDEFCSVREILIRNFGVAKKNKIPEFCIVNDIDGLNGPSESAIVIDNCM